MGGEDRWRRPYNWSEKVPSWSFDGARSSVVLDGNDVGSIESHQMIELPIEPGHHTLQVKAGRYTSPRRPFDTADGEIVNFRCYGGRIWPVYLASIVKPDLALMLKQQ